MNGDVIMRLRRRSPTLNEIREYLAQRLGEVVGAKSVMPIRL